MGRDMEPAIVWQVLRKFYTIDADGDIFRAGTKAGQTSSLTGIPIAGTIFSIYHNYNDLIWFGAAAYMGAALLFATARVVAVGWNPRIIF